MKELLSGYNPEAEITIGFTPIEYEGFVATNGWEGRRKVIFTEETTNMLIFKKKK